MKVFCPTLGERNTIAHTLFPEEWEFSFVVDQFTDASSLEAKFGKRVLQLEIEDPNRITRLSEIRTKMEIEFTDLGEWHIGVDDDIGGITMLDRVMYDAGDEDLDYEMWSAKDWHDWFSHRASPDDVRHVFAQIIEKCEEMGTIYGGTSFFDNPFYRKRKWAHAGYVNGGLHVKKSDGRPWRWAPNGDMEMSCYCLQKYGSVVLNRWAHCLFKDSTEGGMLTFSEEWKAIVLENIEKLMRAYPGLLKPDGFRMKVLKNSLRSVENWRRRNGWI